MMQERADRPKDTSRKHRHPYGPHVYVKKLCHVTYVCRLLWLGTHRTSHRKDKLCSSNHKERYASDFRVVASSIGQGIEHGLQ